MRIQKIAILGAALLLLGAAGCQSNRFASFGGNGSARSVAPAPLPAAPSGTITAQQLPPPAMTPPPPPPPTGTQVAAIDPAAGTTPPAGGAQVTEGSVAGVWNVSVAGQNCRVATPRTKFGQGYRAAPLRCPAPLDGVKSWNVQGGQVLLFDENGGTLASLSSTGGESFSGSTTSGQPVSLSR